MDKKKIVKFIYKTGEIGMYIYFFCLLISKAGINIGLSLMALAFILLLLFKEYGNFKFLQEEKVLFSFFVLVCVAGLFSPGGILSAKISLQKTYRYLGIFLIPVFIQNRKILWQAIIVSSVGFLVSFIHSFSVYKSLDWNFYSRYVSFSDNTLNEAHIIAMLICLFFSVVLYSLKTKKILLQIYSFLVLITSFLALLLSQGRGAWLGAIVAIITILLLLLITGGVRINKKGLISILIVAVLGIGIFKSQNIKNNIYIQRLESIKEINNDSPKIRLIMWEGAVEIYKNHPLFGVGRDNSSKFYLEYFEKNKKYDEVYDGDSLKRIGKAGNAHSMYFQLLVEEGVIVFIFISLLAYLFYQETKLLKKYNYSQYEYFVILGVIGMLVAFSVGGLTENNWRGIWKSATFCASLGIYLSMKKNYLKNNFEKH